MVCYFSSRVRGKKRGNLLKGRHTIVLGREDEVEEFEEPESSGAEGEGGHGDDESEEEFEDVVIRSEAGVEEELEW